MKVAIGGEVELDCTRVGRGAPVLVMHGGLGLDHVHLRPAADRLADAAEWILYDHRGNGASTRPASWEGIGHATWADDADRLRAALGFESTFVFGESYGAFLALEYALRHPGRVRGLILANGAPAFDYQPKVMANAQRKGTPRQLELLAGSFSHPTTDDAEFGRSWLELLPLYFHDYRSHHARAFDGTRYSAMAFAWAFGRCLPSYDVRARLGELKMPALVLGGDDDWISPAEEGAQRLGAGLPDATVRVFDRCGHFPALEHPEAFDEVVRAFLAARA